MINDKTTGREQMLIIATRAAGPHQDFTYLAQASLPETVRKGPQGLEKPDSTRGQVLAFENRLLQAGFGQSAIQTREFEPTTPENEVATLRVLQWKVATPISSNPVSPAN